MPGLLLDPSSRASWPWTTRYLQAVTHCLLLPRCLTPAIG